MQQFSIFFRSGDLEKMENQYGSLWAKLLFLECFRLTFINARQRHSVSFDSNEWLDFPGILWGNEFCFLKEVVAKWKTVVDLFCWMTKGQNCKCIIHYFVFLVIFFVSVCIAANDSIFYKANLESAASSDETIVCCFKVLVCALSFFCIM